MAADARSGLGQTDADAVWDLVSCIGRGEKGMVCLSCIYIIDFVIYASFALDVLVPVLVAIDKVDVFCFFPTTVAHCVNQ